MANTTSAPAKHPKGLYVCGLTFTFERFAYYGSKTLLLLFLSYLLLSILNFIIISAYKFLLFL